MKKILCDSCGEEIPSKTGVDLLIVVHGVNYYVRGMRKNYCDNCIREKKALINKLIK